MLPLVLLLLVMVVTFVSFGQMWRTKKAMDILTEKYEETQGGQRPNDYGMGAMAYNSDWSRLQRWRTLWLAIAICSAIGAIPPLLIWWIITMIRK